MTGALAKTLAAILAAGAAFAAPAAGAADCAPKRDLLASVDPVLAAVRPADCATVLPEISGLAWPSLGDVAGYVVTLRHPDGQVESIHTRDNGIPMERPLPPGTYTWQVSVAGSSKAGEARSFTVDGAS